MLGEGISQLAADEPEIPAQIIAGITSVIGMKQPRPYHKLPNDHKNKKAAGIIAYPDGFPYIAKFRSLCYFSII
jgi:hypothetical protein